MTNSADAIKRALAGPQRHCCIIGPQETTTESILRAIVTRAIKAENSTHLVLQGLDAEILTVVVAWVPRVFSEHYPNVEYKLDQASRFIRLANGSEIHFASVESEIHFHKLMRREYASIYCRSASELSPSAVAALRLHLCQRALQADGRQLKLKAYYDDEQVAASSWLHREFIGKEHAEGYDPVDSVLHRTGGEIVASETADKPDFEGRPSDFTWELGKEICVRTADGEMLTSICSDDHMPMRSTVNSWLLLEETDDHKEFRRIYERARELQADTLFDETLGIADDTTRDWKLVGKNRDVEVPATEVIQRSKLRVETRMKIAAELNPGKYKTKDGLQSKEDSGPGALIIKGGLPDD